MSELEQKIKDNASGPKSAESDGQKVEQHSIKDQIEADRYLNSKQAMKNKSLGIRISKLCPPGGA
ncbi:MAG: hypothetical protein PHV82_05825 [Victivallaceae bacterium]|jgi:hypothetical protein|nr:hypothetical protein [Victivallaceae bacterium]